MISQQLRQSILDHFVFIPAVRAIYSLADKNCNLVHLWVEVATDNGRYDIALYQLLGSADLHLAIVQANITLWINYSLVGFQEKVIPDDARLIFHRQSALA